jgi:geranylgeranyl diphosphate synthase, type II
LEFLKPYSALIEKNLQSLPLPASPSALYEPQRYILSSGGKRVRPVLVLMSCGICGSDINKALPAALAVELLHNFTLIHDDIMDQAGSRRGNPSVHTKWDEATAILAGDGMFVQSLLQLQNLSVEIDHKKVSEIFLNGINTVCEGQALDMEFENRKDVSGKEYLKMIGGKTAALLSASMQIGGVCAGAGDEDLKKLDIIGTSLGLAFQIQDDWLDVVADPEKFGKRKAGDIYEGKKTFLMLSALENCGADDRDKLLSYLEQLPLTSKQVDEVIGIYEKCGVSEDAKSTIKTYYSEAEKTLNEFADSNYKQDLFNLINFLKYREL